MADHIKDLPAGAARLVRNLYSSGKTKEIGLSYSQKNRDRIEESKANGTFVPNPVDPKKTEVPFARPIVPVPKVGGGGGNRANSGDAAATSPSSSGNFYRPHRRPYDEIKEELDRRIQENMEETRSYRPRGPLMDEKEKTRLATLNEWNGKPPEEVMQAALSGVKLPSRSDPEHVLFMSMPFFFSSFMLVYFFLCTEATEFRIANSILKFRLFFRTLVYND